MKKKIIIAIAVLLIVVTFACAGCSLFANPANDLANKDSSSNSSSTKTGDGNVAALEEALSQYRLLVDSLSQKVTSLEGELNDIISSSQTIYVDVTKEELEETLTNYRNMMETLSDRIIDLEDALRNAVSTSKTSIGSYAVTMVDSFLNISCMESQYNIGCQGSGFIISDDGYVLTNNHVVYYDTTITERVQNGWFITERQIPVSGEYSSITGVFDKKSKYYNNGATYQLELIYRDASYDLALCKLVESAPIGSSWEEIPFYDGTVSRGDDVLVLGNARGQGFSATAGIVSMTGKTFTDYPQVTFIQTDAAINGGNSGGPAVNIYGGLIGVVNSKFVSIIKNSYFSSEIEDVEGMGFAIELDKVKEFISAAETIKNIKVNYSTVKAN